MVLGRGRRPPAADDDDPEQSCVCFSYLYFLLNDLSHAGHLYIRSPTEWTSLRCLCILFRVVSTLQTIHFANFVFSGTRVHKPGIILLMRSFWFQVFFWRNFEVKQIFCHYCEPHDLCVSDWPNVFFLCKLWNSMDKFLEIGAAKNGFHENDVEHWLWIEIWSRMSNNNIRFRNHLLMDMALPLLEFFVLLQKRRNPNDTSRETILCGTIFVKKPNHSLILNHI